MTMIFIMIMCLVNDSESARMSHYHYDHNNDMGSFHEIIIIIIITIPSGYLPQPWKITILIGKPSMNGPCSMAMLNNQRVIIAIHKTMSQNVDPHY